MPDNSIADATKITGREVAGNCLGFKKVDYKSLKARQKELFNFQKIAATLADYGFNCIKLADGWNGADFLAYQQDGTNTLKIQLKSRLSIDQKYVDKDIWIAFPHSGLWYLIKHDSLVEKVRQHTKWLTSSSWRNMNGYSSISINPVLLESLTGHKIGPVYGHVFPTD
jgi:frataxin-like iron-binding protein CyaY